MLQLIKNLFKKKEKLPWEETALVRCPKCGTYDCISMEEYRRHISISGAGVVSVPSSAILKSCKARQQLNSLKKLHKTRHKRIAR